MNSVRFTLDQLPEHLRKQAAAKLAADGPQNAPQAPEATSAPKARKTRADAPHAQDQWLGASKTEQQFYKSVLFPHFRFADVYEPVRLRLAPGTFYTPDFFYEENGQVYAIEVKGSYRLGSASRAYTAFMTARDKYPWINFEWWQSKNGGFVRKH